MEAHRRASMPMLAASKPSMRTRPPVMSIRRNRHSMRDDLPLPVRPTTPQEVPPCPSRRQHCNSLSWCQEFLVQYL